MALIEEDITSIVVVYNEERRLDECLSSLSFSDELLVVDLGSEDQSVEIAESHEATVIHHERLPIVEQIRVQVIDEARNDWVLFADPDEVFCRSLLNDVQTVLYDSSDIGLFSLPLQFYFKSRPLNGTKWGGKNHKPMLIHKRRCRLSPDVHRGFEVKDGYRTVRIPWEEGSGHVRHYWIDSYHQLFEKHFRYIREEGRTRYNEGERFSWRRLLYEPLAGFKRSLIDQRGWREGARGIFLSAFWAWYKGASLLSLRRYEKSEHE